MVSVVLLAAAALALATGALPSPGPEVQLEVRGTSMTGLLPDGAAIEADLGYYALHPVGRGEVAIIALSFRSTPIVKRVLALPGDRVALRPGPRGARLLVDGVALTTPSGAPYTFSGKREQMLRLYVDRFQGVMPEGLYLVFGTDPEGTLDSSQIGPIERAALRGRVRSVAGRRL